MIKNLYDFKSNMDRDGIILSYSGPINQDIIEGLSSVVKEKLKLENISMGTSLKIFSVFIEQIQNILFYSKDIQKNESSENLKNGLTVIGRISKEQFFVLSGNEVSEIQKERLSKKLDKVANLSKDELKKLYKEARKVESDEFSNGAGLGFLEMARKSSQPLEYNFEQIGEDKFFFSLNIIV